MLTKLKCCVDLHVHTRRFSPCAEALNPDQLHLAMVRCGLHGLVITEHDHLWSAEEIAALNVKLNNRRIYRGVEVSSRNGHFVVIGLNGLEGIARGIGVDDLVHVARSHNGAVIWAHPHLHYNNTPSPMAANAMPAGIHAVEVASGLTTGNNTVEATAFAQEMGWATVGGSDAHVLSQVGCAYTLFPNLPADEKALAAAIRTGHCVAVHRPGNDG